MSSISFPVFVRKGSGLGAVLLFFFALFGALF